MLEMTLAAEEGVTAAAKTIGTDGVAKQTVERCFKQMNRRYEQGADQVRTGD